MLQPYFQFRIFLYLQFVELIIIITEDVDSGISKLEKLKENGTTLKKLSYYVCRSFPRVLITTSL